MSTITGRIREILRASPEPLRIDDIHARMPDVPRAKVANAIYVYADHQKFERVGVGRQARYRLAQMETIE